MQGDFFLKINKRAGQIPIHVYYGINVQGEFFLKNNKRADQNKAVQGEFFLKINKRACTSIWYNRVDAFEMSNRLMAVEKVYSLWCCSIIMT